MNPQLAILALFLAWFAFPVSVQADTAMAIVQGIEEDSELFGVVIFEDTGDGVRMTADFIGVEPGEHSLQFHEQGDCREDAKAAGVSVFKAGTIKINEEMAGSLETTLSEITVSESDKSIAERSLMIYQGESEKKTGCGIIVGTTESNV